MKIYRVKPGARFSLGAYDPEGPGDIGSKEEGIARLAELRADIQDLQRVLFAENSQRLLVILQAMDTGGKDGTVRQVFSGIDPHGMRVVSFKAPTALDIVVLDLLAEIEALKAQRPTFGNEQTGA